MKQEKKQSATLWINGRKVANVKSVRIQCDEADLLTDLEREQDEAAADIRQFLWSRVAEGTPLR